MMKLGPKNVVTLAWASTVGLFLVISTAVGLGIGVYLDRKLGTSPWLTVFFLIIGIAAGFWNILREVISSNTKKQK